jgi:hypothetical protein
MQKRPKDGFAQSYFNYFSCINRFLLFSQASLRAKHNELKEPNKLNKLFLTSTTSMDFYRLFFFDSTRE